MSASMQRLVSLAAKRYSVDASTIEPQHDIFEKLNIDSFQAVELMSELELEFDVEIPDYELQGVKTFQRPGRCDRQEAVMLHLNSRMNSVGEAIRDAIVTYKTNVALIESDRARASGRWTYPRAPRARRSVLRHCCRSTASPRGIAARS